MLLGCIELKGCIDDVLTVALDLCEAMDRADDGRGPTPAPAPLPDLGLEEVGREEGTLSRWLSMSGGMRG